MLHWKQKYYLIDDGNENEKAKDTQKKCVIKQKFKPKGYKNCREANQLEIETNHLESDNIEVDNLRENHKGIIKAIY